jgi:hypothetical protein
MGGEGGMKWHKLGRVFCPCGDFPWMTSHAANPVALPLDEKRVRFLFSCRDAEKRSSIGSVDIDLDHPLRLLALSQEPVLAPGGLGLFDDCGTTMGCVVAGDDGATALYYLGWNLGRPAPWRNSIGLARLQRDRAERVSLAPVLDRDHHDPLSLSYPWVLRESDRWRMWYGSHLTWGAEPPESMVHVLKYAESEDGIHWRRDGRVVLGEEVVHQPASPQVDHAFSRPCVLHDHDGYRMWYSCRGPRYRLGYATSADGLHWQRRDDEVGISVSAADWDSEMLAYAHVFDQGGSRYMDGLWHGRSRAGLILDSEARNRIGESPS